MPAEPPATPLRKFTLHPPTLVAPASVLTLAHSTSQPFTTQSLAALRTALLSSRTLAAERIAVKDANRRNLSERQAVLNRVLEETQRVKEVERKKKREEEERKDKERRLLHEKANEGMQLDEPVVSMGTAPVKPIAQKPAVLLPAPPAALPSNLNGDIASRVDPLAATKQRIASSSAASTPLPTPTPIHAISSAPGSIPASVANSISAVPSPLSAAMETSDEEDEFGQPKPPNRRRNNKNDKKKRKRDQIIDSDNSGDDAGAPSTEKYRKLSPRLIGSNLTSATPQPTPPPGTIASTSTLPPPVKPTLSHFRQKLKMESFLKHTIPTRPPAYGTASAFYIPPSALVPALAPSVPNPPTPKRQGEVCEDFSKAKVGTQITFHTFHTWAESYLRVFGEDDLAFLARQGDEVAPYVVPPLGKYYQERWEEEDTEASSTSRDVTRYLSSLAPAPLVRARPENLTEDSLGMENVYCGPLTERLMSALQFTNEEPMEGELLGGLANGKAVRRDVEMNDADGKLKNELDAIELEERIKAELKFIGIVPTEEIDWSTREDDEITSSLRLCQAELAAQVVLNTSRKSILSSIVKDRMGYQDYEATRDAQERVIENGWSKRQKGSTKKKIGRKDASSRDHSKKDKSLDDGWEGKGPISLSLLGALLKREKLVGTFKPFFEDESDVGRFFGIPEESVFAELEEEL